MTKFRCKWEFKENPRTISGWALQGHFGVGHQGHYGVGHSSDIRDTLGVGRSRDTLGSAWRRVLGEEKI